MMVVETSTSASPRMNFSITFSSSTSFICPWPITTRADGTPLETKSDGYATGLVVYVLQQLGGPRSQPVSRGLDWLATHQDASTGLWFAASLNKQRDPASDTGRFMSDAATAYAVLALTRAQR